MAFKGTFTKSVANSYSCKWFVKKTYEWGCDCVIRMSKGGLDNEQFEVIKVEYSTMLTRKEEHQFWHIVP